MTSPTHNAKGTTFVWTATAEQILIKVARGRVHLRKSINSETHHYRMEGSNGSAVSFKFIWQVLLTLDGTEIPDMFYGLGKSAHASSLEQA